MRIAVAGSECEGGRRGMEPGRGRVDNHRRRSSGETEAGRTAEDTDGLAEGRAEESTGVLAGGREGVLQEDSIVD